MGASDPEARERERESVTPRRVFGDATFVPPSLGGRREGSPAPARARCLGDGAGSPPGARAPGSGTGDGEEGRPLRKIYCRSHALLSPLAASFSSPSGPAKGSANVLQRGSSRRGSLPLAGEFPRPFRLAFFSRDARLTD